MKFETIDAMVCRTTSKTFQAYWKEMRRHEKALKKIYEKDKLHKHVPEEISSFHQVSPRQRHINNYEEKNQN